MVRFPYQVSYVTTASQLAAAISHLQSCESISVDIEFDKDRVHYGFTLCLLQIAAAQTIYVIDALLVKNLTALFSVFENSNIEKIMHCPGEDLRLLHGLNCFPTSVFDTEIAAKLLNYELTSLAAMLNQKLNIQIDKSLQKSDWTKRPLSIEQIEYAAQDVVFLHELKNVLSEEAKAKLRWELIIEENKQLSKQRFVIEKRDNFLKKDDFLQFSFKQRWVLNELLKYRDEIAQELNLPAYRTMDEYLIRSICKQEIDFNNWVHLKGLHPLLKNDKYGRLFQQKFADLLLKVADEASNKNKKH
jgi:ribonuclease D